MKSLFDYTDRVYLKRPLVLTGMVCLKSLLLV